MTGGQVSRARRAAHLVDLVQLVGRGDSGAFAALYDETSSSVYGLTLSVVRSPQLAETLTLEVYAEAWQRAASYDPSESTVLAWLISMAHGHVVNRVRAMSQDSVPERFSGPNGEREFDRLGWEIGPRSDVELARTALCSLSPTDRKAVTLAYFGGYSQTEVADMLGQPVGTVRASIRDGMVALRAAIGVGS